MRASLPLQPLDLVLTARGVLTRSRWSKRPSTTMLSSATTPTTGGATPPMSPTMSPSKRRTVKRTLGRTVSSSTSRLPSTRLLRSAGPPLVKDCDVQGPEICRTEYESECWTKQEVHDVQDDVVSCRTEVEEKCEDNTSGYTTNTKCSKWPKEVCSVAKKPVKKYTPITGCTKEL